MSNNIVSTLLTGGANLFQRGMQEASSRAQLETIRQLLKWTVDGSPSLTKKEKWVLEDLNSASIHYDGRELNAFELNTMLEKYRAGEFVSYNRKENAQKMYPMGYGTLKKARGEEIDNYAERIFSGDTWASAGKLFARTIFDPLGVLINLGKMIGSSHETWGQNNQGVEDFFSYSLEQFGIDVALEVGTLGVGTVVAKSKRAQRAMNALAEMRAKAIVHMGAGIRNLSPQLRRAVARSIKRLKSTNKNIYDKYIRGESAGYADDLLESLMTAEEKQALKEAERVAPDVRDLSKEMDALNDVAHYKKMEMLGSDTNQFAGFLSSNVYKDIEKRPVRIGDYVRESGFATSVKEETDVYINHATGDVFIAMRGSKTSEDWLTTDVAIALNRQKFTRRFKETDALLQDIHKAYPDYKISTTGHSLAGGASYYLGEKYATQDWFKASIGFNSASSPLGEVSTSFKEALGLGADTEIAMMNKKIVNIRQGLDVVSGAGFPHGKTITYVSPSGWNPATAHSMSVFTDTKFTQVPNPTAPSQLILNKIQTGSYQFVARETLEEGLRFEITDADGNRFSLDPNNYELNTETGVLQMKSVADTQTDDDTDDGDTFEYDVNPEQDAKDATIKKNNQIIEQLQDEIDDINNTTFDDTDLLFDDKKRGTEHLEKEIAELRQQNEDAGFVYEAVPVDPEDVDPDNVMEAEYATDDEEYFATDTMGGSGDAEYDYPVYAPAPPNSDDEDAEEDAEEDDNVLRDGFENGFGDGDDQVFLPAPEILGYIIYPEREEHLYVNRMCAWVA